jgi:uncharacterized repeat protein (TIGR01451 family)
MYLKKSKLVAALLFFIVLLPVLRTQVQAQEANKSFLSVDLKGYLISTTKDEKGSAKETLQNLPETVLPGSLIQYEIIAFNSSKGCPCSDTLKNVSLLGVVPVGTTYVESSATSFVPPAFSMDGGRSYSPWPVKYTVKSANGTLVEKVAEADMITGIRWILESLKPQETISFIYRVRVLAK